MKQTQKYSKATSLLKFPHSNQEQLYSELNRLGWWWDSKIKEWKRDDRIANAATDVIKLRVWASSQKVEQVTQLLIESLDDIGLELIEKSAPYQCRPPQQNDSRIYLTLRDKGDE